MCHITADIMPESIANLKRENNDLKSKVSTSRLKVEVSRLIKLFNTGLASLRNRYVLALFYVSLNSIYCIVVSSLLFSPSIYKSCFVICLQLPSPRLVYKLFAGGKFKVM